MATVAAEFGLPKLLLRGPEDLSARLLRSGLDADFDLAFTRISTAGPWSGSPPGTSPPRYPDSLDLSHTMEAYFTWHPAGTVAWWEAEQAGLILNCPAPERTTWLAFTDAERQALAGHDYVALLELGAHNFLVLTVLIALFERDYAEPLAFQREFAVRRSHWTLPYPDIAT